MAAGLKRAIHRSKGTVHGGAAKLNAFPKVKSKRKRK